MTRVRMLVEFTGFSIGADGKTFEWPRSGNEIDLDDNVAHDLIRARQAVLVESPPRTTSYVPADEETRGVSTPAEVIVRPPTHVEISASDEVAAVADTVTSSAQVASAEEDDDEDDDDEPATSAQVARRPPGRPRR